MLNKRMLITGAKGFLGSNVARYFKSLGYETYGLGHGELSVDQFNNLGLDYWKDSDVSLSAIVEFQQIFDVILHCAGSGSVGFSVENPYADYKKTVAGTLEILEFMRLYNPYAHLIYPSSPAVQGEHPDSPIEETFIGEPCSPYGYHKKIAELLCQSYSKQFNLKVSVVRLFSVYGIGLKKQLLWDAVNKLKNAESAVEFWGTGNETRDFIHISDVLKLFEVTLCRSEQFFILNGGTGRKSSIKSVVSHISDLLSTDVHFYFNNEEKSGNPIYYWASIEKLKLITSINFLKFKTGLAEYVRWANEQ